MIAIDLGSNTLRIVQLDCSNGQYVNAYEKIVKTADGLVDTGMISVDAVKRIISALDDAKQNLTLILFL